MAVHSIVNPGSLCKVHAKHPEEATQREGAEGGGHAARGAHRGGSVRHGQVCLQPQHRLDVHRCLAHGAVDCVVILWEHEQLACDCIQSKS